MWTLLSSVLSKQTRFIKKFVSGRQYKKLIIFININYWKTKFVKKNLLKSPYLTELNAKNNNFIFIYLFYIFILYISFRN